MGRELGCDGKRPGLAAELDVFSSDDDTAGTARHRWRGDRGAGLVEDAFGAGLDAEVVEQLRDQHAVRALPSSATLPAWPRSAPACSPAG